MTGHFAMTLRRNRFAFLNTGTAMAAALVLAGAAMAAAPAAAQGFNGTVAGATGAFVSGGDITVFGSEAVINWDATATSGTQTNVDFLPAGSSVVYHDIGSGFSGDFTVLNRVTPRFNGDAIPATISFSGDLSSNVGGAAGGNIWFYSPYGIIANSTASFNVGSLLLTTSDVQTTTDQNGGVHLYADSPANTQIGLLDSQAGSFVRVLPGAQLNASSSGGNSSYVALFAPRIEQGGSIRSDAMAALVAGQAGTLTFNNGLISVAVTTGSDDAAGIVHTGSTGGAASSNAETQTVAMVAVPKNTAMTMLLSGAIGYDAAASAGSDGSAVVLYSGSTGQADATAPDGTHLTLTTPVADRTGSIAVGNATFTSALSAFATGDITVNPVYAGVNSPGLVDFRRNVSLTAGRSIALTADAGETIRVQDSMFLAPMLRMTGEDISLKVGGDATGSLADGQISVTNYLFLDASAEPAFGSVPSLLTGRNGTGGDITVDVSRGGLSVGQTLFVRAEGQGENGQDSGGNGIGGTVDIGVSGGGTISATTLSVSADGVGGSFYGSAPQVSTGGTGSGGTILIHDNGGALRFGDVGLFARGFGGVGATIAGKADGGRIGLTIAGQAQNWGLVTADASALGGDFSGGATAARDVVAQANGVTLAVSGTGRLSADTITLENNAYSGAGGVITHTVRGGGVDVLVSDGAQLAVIGDLTLRADAGGGEDPYLGNVVAAPFMWAGSASAVTNGGTIRAGSITVSAEATGIAAGTTGMPALGGTALLSAAAGGVIQTGGAFVSAAARGAVGPAAANAQGGTAQVFAIDGTVSMQGDVSLGNLIVTASAVGGGFDYDFTPTGAGFNATGGTASVDVGAGGQVLAADLRVYAKGEATLATDPALASDLASFTANDIVAIRGNGGMGTGGTAQVNLGNGSIDVDTLEIRANGLGGASGEDPDFVFTSGEGRGGTALLTQTGGALGVGATADISANGMGGTYAAFADGSQAANGGNAAGGTSRLVQSAGAAVFGGGLTINAQAIGGAGMGTNGAAPAGNGGAAYNAFTGLAELIQALGSSGTLTAPTLTVNAGATGGAGGAPGVSANGTQGNGGAAFGGTARVSLADAAIQIAGAAAITASAQGGAGLAGGNATAGTAMFSLTDSLATPATLRRFGALAVTGSAVGGAGASASGTASAGETKFTAQAARAASALVIDGDLTIGAMGAIAPAGDGFVGNFGVIPVSVGGNLFLYTTRDINASTLAGGGINAAGLLSINGRSVTTTGAGTLRGTGGVDVQAANSISVSGLASGGTTFLQALNPATGSYGTVSVTRLSSTGLITANTGSFLAATTGTTRFANSFATTGAFTVQSVSGLTVAQVTAAGAVTLTSAAGSLRNTGAISGNGVTLAANGAILIDGAITSAGGFAASSEGPLTATVPVSALGNVSIDSVGGISMTSLTSGGTTLLRATGGSIAIPVLLSTGAVTLLGQTASLATNGPITLASATTTAGDLSVTSGGNLTAASVDASGAVTLTSASGNVSANGLAATGAVNLGAANGAVSATGVNVGGTIAANGRSVSVASAGALNFAASAATAGGFTVNAGGNASFAGLSATNALAVTSGGAVTFAGAVSAASATVNSGSATFAAVTLPGALAVTTTGAAAFNGTVSAGAVTVNAGGNASFAAVNSTGTLTIAAGGTATFNALAAAPTIAVTSGDIVIGSTGRLGQRGVTSAIALTNSAPSAGTAIGGAAAASGWSLDAAEALRLFADQSISIAVPATATSAADVVIGNLAITYGAGATAQGTGANIGAGGSFTVSTPSRIRVTGTVAPVLAGNTDLFALNAGQRIDVVTDTGSIALRNGAGALAGTLRMSAPTVRVATAAALSALDGITSLAAATARLDGNDGVVNQTGTVAANALEFNVAASTLYIQNSGTDSAFANRRGFLANSIAINGLSGAQPSFAVNGVLNGASGQVTGLGVFPLVRVGTAAAASGGAFNQSSTVNGCAVGIDCSVVKGVPVFPSAVFDSLAAVITAGSGADSVLNMPVVQFAATPILNSPPLIDEPVTGVGNDDLWLKRCGADKDCAE